MRQLGESFLGAQKVTNTITDLIKQKYLANAQFYQVYTLAEDDSNFICNFQYPDLSQIPFPGKKTFNNIERDVREKRMKMLNNYMRILLQLSVIKSHPALQDELLSFLEPEYDKSGPGGQLAKTVCDLSMRSYYFI